MDINLVKDKLNSTEYSFLRENEKLGSNIMLLTLGGSLAYGTNIEGPEHTSDIDLRGIRLHTKNEILSMKPDEKPFENRDLDVVIYPLKQMVSLLTKCNPNTIELLGTKEEHLFSLSEEGRLLRENSDLFLSQLAYNSFGGYATAQLRRLENALARGEYSQAKKEGHILKSMERKIVDFTNRYKPVTKDMLNLYLDDSDKTHLEKEIFMDINLSKYPLRDFVGMYSELRSIAKDYDTLNHRNSKKDEIHLLKHAMHLIRLIKMGTEILEGKGINTYRESDRELLLSIRKGLYTYSEIFEITNSLEKEFEYAKKNTNLPLQVDTKKIDELVIEINAMALKKAYSASK